MESFKVFKTVFENSKQYQKNLLKWPKISETAQYNLKAELLWIGSWYKNVFVSWYWSQVKPGRKKHCSVVNDHPLSASVTWFHGPTPLYPPASSVMLSHPEGHLWRFSSNYQKVQPSSPGITSWSTSFSVRRKTVYRSMSVIRTAVIVFSVASTTWKAPSDRPKMSSYLAEAVLKI